MYTSKVINIKIILLDSKTIFSKCEYDNYQNLKSEWKLNVSFLHSQVDSSTESAEAACDILSQLVNCSLKTLGLISTARPSFMELPKVSEKTILLMRCLDFLPLTIPFIFFLVVALYLCTNSGVCELQVPFISKNWWHTSGWSFSQGTGGQQQRHPQAVKDEQLSACFSCRYECFCDDVIWGWGKFCLCEVGV